MQWTGNATLLVFADPHAPRRIAGRWFCHTLSKSRFSS